MPFGRTKRSDRVSSKEIGMSLLIKRLNSEGFKIKPWRCTPLAYGNDRVCFWPIFMGHVELEYKLFIKQKETATDIIL